MTRELACAELRLTLGEREPLSFVFATKKLVREPLRLLQIALIWDFPYKVPQQEKSQSAEKAAHGVKVPRRQHMVSL